MPSLPAPLVSFLSLFPLHTFPPISPPSKTRLVAPTLWILPPRQEGSDDLLSTDVECLKWQAYLALRGLPELTVRWDIASDGGIGGSLPNLHAPAVPGDKSEGAEDGELLAAHLIPTWVDGQLAGNVDPLEGYQSQACLDESHAWVSLLEGKVHNALILYEKPASWLALIWPSTPKPVTINTATPSPPQPLMGIASVLPVALFSFPLRGPNSAHTPSPSPAAIDADYKEAISALSQRLGADKWFLSSERPTPLDALAFAYLHTILHSEDVIRTEVTQRVNLVAWESRVRGQINKVFVRR